ncbi:hypothetical protein JT327_gp44 [Aeromonas phage LAh_7]|uniref:Uncharacterized protein n=1 Tax=Aeromonas phage LAh_7 TaxID=2591031 RepID=A0A514A095_9CAUD|nr:hypothetical protein JT327_gp44 [Aeromonas phage LAh_7]QDH46689.1 hypothetical protein LAh7_44 [Aeromonas phage LAh_7]
MGPVEKESGQSAALFCHDSVLPFNRSQILKPMSRDSLTAHSALTTTGSITASSGRDGSWILNALRTVFAASLRPRATVETLPPVSIADPVAAATRSPKFIGAPPYELETSPHAPAAKHNDEDRDPGHWSPYR